MVALYAILLVFATVCFFLAVIGTRIRSINLVALGLFFWVLVALLQTLSKLL